MDITYALLREGSSDIALKTIVERYAQTRGHTLIFNEALSKPFNGPLGEQTVKIRTRNNFDDSTVEMAFYFADRDKGEFNKLESIENAIRSVNELYLAKSIIGIPDPHMEVWLLTDQNAVKAVFGLVGDRPVPHSDVEPKKRLELLSNEFGSDELTPPEARKKLAETLDLGVVERNCPSFNNFIQHFNEYLNAHNRV